jgi:hypothetical protein
MKKKLFSLILFILISNAVCLYGQKHGINILNDIKNVVVKTSDKQHAWKFSSGEPLKLVIADEVEKGNTYNIFVYVKTRNLKNSDKYMKAEGIICFSYVKELFGSHKLKQIVSKEFNQCPITKKEWNDLELQDKTWEDLKFAVNNDQKGKVSEFINYPLIMDRGDIKIKNKKDLIKYYDEIFTKEFKNTISKSIISSECKYLSYLGDGPDLYYGKDECVQLFINFNRYSDGIASGYLSLKKMNGKFKVYKLLYAYIGFNPRDVFKKK